MVTTIVGVTSLEWGVDHAVHEQLNELPIATFTRFNNLGRTLEGAKRACDRWKKSKNAWGVAASVTFQDRVDYIEQASKFQQERIEQTSDK